MRPPHTRRSVLSAVGAALPVALAGCLAGTPGDDPATGDDSPADDGSPEESQTDEQPTGSTPRGRPEVDCATASRPPVSPIGDAETPTDASRYPERPDSVADESAVETYLTEYERAYRRNSLAEGYGEELTTAGVPLGSTRVFDSREGSAVVRVRYQYYYEYSDDDPDTTAVIHADSATTYATYYLDDRVLVRAEETGRLADESVLRPDPWSSGTVVECWE
ncbi:hypothetical protein [Salinirubrum litoreum]|uniref:Uncharacterized protein n=1 Tax=Salinirubrum litoreum TaxID=1126234 RepID=A0ABD5RAS1_9EURY|nr:hypothetical protein [Salinirubrum litoreum]